ncbi:hypothetical protein N431DRAFT_384870 [Stipitochalara longipes BDJ]|nr:hypothetical protein N431DRAFT_384870 [Stipitochalara longipes BDJ]
MADIGGYGPIIIATMWAETGLTLLFVALRLYTRIRINRTVGWDDYLISLASIMMIPYSAACTLAAIQGLGRHSAELSLDQFMQATRYIVIGQTFSLVGIAASKASVAAFLLRITIHQWHKWTLYILIFIVTISCFLCALFDYIRCDPIESIWNFFIPGKCWMDAKGFTTLSAVVGGISAAADFILAILPWFILWNLQMKRKDKNLIASSMSLGFFAGVCGIIRTTTVERIFTGVDYSYETVGLILWSSTELTVTILTATIPTLRPLYKQLFLHQPAHSYRLNAVQKSPSNFNFSPYVPSKYQTSSTVSAGATTHSRTDSDRSDKSIINHGAAPGEGAIVCTDVVYVEFEERQNPATPDLERWSKRHAQLWEIV